MAKNSTKNEQSEKLHLLDTALSQIEKNYGKGSIMKFGDWESMDIATISTGSMSLDIALGIGGIPRGRISEIYGPESSGKTTLALHVVANAQKAGGVAAYIDAEHAMDPTYTRNLGVNHGRTAHQPSPTRASRPWILRRAIGALQFALDVIVIDSVAALVPKAEIDGEMGDSFVGLQARLMSQAMRKLTGALIGRSHTSVIFINQIREKIGVMFGNPETTTGGNALKFYSSIRLDIRRISALKEGDQKHRQPRARQGGQEQVRPPPSAWPSSISSLARGISYEGDLLDLAVLHKVVDKSGRLVQLPRRANRSRPRKRAPIL